MSPKSRGRKPKPGKNRRSGHGPARRPESPAAALLREVGRELRGADPLDAELLVCVLLAGLAERTAAAAAPFLRPPGDPVLDLLRDVGAAGTPEALGLLRCIALLGDPDQRAVAAEVADALAAAGVATPSWARELTAVRPVAAWRIRDVFGDVETITVEFERGGRRHALAVLVDQVARGTAVGALVSDEPDELRAEQEEEMVGPLTVLEELPLEEAQARLAAAFAATDADPDAEVDEDYETTRALALARMRALPAGRPVPPPEALDEQARAAVTTEFLASAEFAPLRGRPGAEPCARRIVPATAIPFPGERVGTSPGRLTRLLLHELPEEELDDDEIAAVPDVVVAWARFAGQRAGLPAEAVDQLIGAATELGTIFPSVYAEPELLGEAGEELAMSYIGDLLEDDAELDPDDLPEVLLRRTFAMPGRTAWIRGEEYPSLDPSDPDDRQLLITAEHPEYAEALEDPAVDTVDGTNPRLHIAIHEVVANQLWADDPPEAWQAARRLLDAGMERHDVLHALAEVVTEHLWQALAEQRPADVEAYRRALDALGAADRPETGG